MSSPISMHCKEEEHPLIIIFFIEVTRMKNRQVLTKEVLLGEKIIPPC